MNFIDSVQEVNYQEAPSWFRNWENIGLIAWKDKNEDGSFVYASDNLALNWNSWAPGEPGNSSTGENCVQVTDNGKWSVLPCEGNERSPICMRGSNC